MKKKKTEKTEAEPFPRHLPDKAMEDEQWKDRMGTAMHAAVNEALRGMEPTANGRAVYWGGDRLKAMLFIARR